MEEGALLGMEWRGMSCIRLGFFIARGSSFPGICIISQVSASFLVLVVSHNYIRRRQNVKFGVQTRALRQYIAVAVWFESQVIYLLQVCHWCILNWRMCKSFNSAVDPFTAKVIRELICNRFVRQGVFSKHVLSRWTLQIWSLIPSGNPPFSRVHFSHQAQVRYMIINKNQQSVQNLTDSELCFNFLFMVCPFWLIASIPMTHCILFCHDLTNIYVPITTSSKLLLPKYIVTHRMVALH